MNFITNNNIMLNLNVQLCIYTEDKSAFKKFKSKELCK